MARCTLTTPPSSRPRTNTSRSRGLRLSSAIVISRPPRPRSSWSKAPAASRPGGRGILRHCFFGAARATMTPWISLAAPRDQDQPILQVYNNVFIGSGDDLMDIDGTDVWIEGNIFLHIHRNGSPDSSAAVSGGSSSRPHRGGHDPRQPVLRLRQRGDSQAGQLLHPHQQHHRPHDQEGRAGCRIRRGLCP